MRTPSGVAITKEDDTATFCALVLCGNLDVWVRNGSGEQSGVWGVLYRSMQALSPMLEHTYRILPPCCNEDHGEVVLAIQMLDKKLKESISAMSSLMRLGNELKLTDLVG